MKPNIMFVDDSISVLKSLRWIFMDEPYQFFPFVSPLKALNAIEDKKFAVVVADQTMPKMTGIEFLKKIKQRSPDTERMIMCGYVKPETASIAMIRGVVSRFIEKPLDIDEIKQAVVIAIARYEININSRRKRMLLIQPRRVFSFQQ